MKTIKIGDVGSEVKLLQELLEIKIDGIFGPITESHVKDFQSIHNLTADGIVGPVTWEVLLMNHDTDLRKTNIETMYLSAGRYEKNAQGNQVWIPNYYGGQIKPEWFFLHHTAGGPNPYQTIKIWENDTKPVATRFVIGGMSNSCDNTYDGVTVECLKDGQWAAHLTVGSTKVHRESLGLEICNYGGCTKGGYFAGNKWIGKDSKKFYNAYGTEMNDNQVYDLGWKYRYHQYFHKYTDKQIEKTYELLKYVQAVYGIDVNYGLKSLINKYSVKHAFSYIPDYINENQGLYTHGNIYSGKNDISPQPEMIDMIMSL